MKEKYITPDITVSSVNVDIITYSETEVWQGPVVESPKREPQA